MRNSLTVKFKAIFCKNYKTSLAIMFIFLGEQINTNKSQHPSK